MSLDLLFPVLFYFMITLLEESLESRGWQLEEINGDLFTSSITDSLAHCVSADFHMKRGIAVDFYKLFPKIKTLIGTKVGGVGV